MSVRCLRLAELRARYEDNLQLQEVQDHARNDQEYQDLIQFTQAGFPDHKGDLPPNLRKFWGSKGHLSVDDDLLVYGNRLFIPTTFRPTILEQLHEAHQGIARSKDRARLTVYWPGIDQDIEMYIADCKFCQDSLSSHPREPIITKPRPSRPFQEVAVDFAYYGGNTFSWWWIVLPTGPTSSLWALTPRPQTPFGLCVTCSAARQLRMLSGLMVGHSSHPTSLVLF